VLVGAGGSVGTAAGTEFDAALVEVLMEVGPLLRGGVPVLLFWPFGPAPGEELVVVADHVLVEDRDVAAGGSDIERAEQSGADVDRQAVVDQLGGEEPAEVVGREPDVLELRVCQCEVVAGSADHAPDGDVGHAALGAAVEVLEQVGQCFAPGPLVAVVADADRDGAVLVAVAPDDLGDDVEELGGHGDDPFTVALGRSDDEQSHDLAVGPLVLPDAEMRQLDQLLGPQTRQPQCFDDGPLPEGVDLVPGEVDQFTGGAVDRSDRRAVVPLVLGGDAEPDGALGGELLADLDLQGGIQQGSQAVPSVVDVLGKDRKEGLAVAGAVGHALLQPAPCGCRVSSSP
jgi:hypothetical protein